MDLIDFEHYISDDSAAGNFHYVDLFIYLFIIAAVASRGRLFYNCDNVFLLLYSQVIC